MPIYWDADDGRDLAGDVGVARAMQPIQLPFSAPLREQLRQVLRSGVALLFGHGGHHAAAPTCASLKNGGETLGEGAR